MPLSTRSFLCKLAIFAWVAFFAWASLIWYLSSMTPQDLQVMPSELLAFDKLVHATAFAAGGALLGLALRHTTRLRGGRLFAAIVVGIGLFGALDEIHQLYTPGRMGADLYDWLADMIGGSCAAFVYSYFYGKPDPARSPGPDTAAPQRD
ncbi:MAG TPA: VanZ family protein [Chthoniobacterales bacterium]|jgi:VanZ family protein